MTQASHRSRTRSFQSPSCDDPRDRTAGIAVWPAGGRQKRALPTDIIAGLFGLAACPQVEVPDFLEAVLSSALDLTGADVGGAIFVPSSKAEKLFWSMKALEGSPRQSCKQLIQGWSRDDGAIRFPVPADSPYGAIQPSAAGDDVALFQESRRTAWVPILVGEPRRGRLQVEAGEHRAFSARQLQSLAELARQAGLLARRLLLREYAADRGFDLQLVGKSPALLELEWQLTLIAADPKSPVLIHGERGSGKELAAHAIHYFGARRPRPFLAINCATLSDGLSADALFGHSRGAFTGAEAMREGIFRHAAGGTLFFDEVGDMSPAVQAALLRVLDSGEVRQVGSDHPFSVDVRIIAATNRDLEHMIAEGTFRADLHDRLNVFQVSVPPLRKRREDLGLLADFFFRKACAQNGRRERRRERNACLACLKRAGRACADSTFYEELAGYDFPGNVRELRNLIFRVSALVDEEVRSFDLRECLPTGEKREEELQLDAVLRSHIARVLQMTGGNKSEAAQILGLPLSTLFNKMKRLGMA